MTPCRLLRRKARPSQLIDATNTGADGAVAIYGEAKTAMTENGTPTHLNDPLTVIDPDSAEPKLAEVDAAGPFGDHGSLIFNAASGVWTYLLETSQTRRVDATAIANGQNDRDASP